MSGNHLFLENILFLENKDVQSRNRKVSFQQKIILKMNQRFDEKKDISHARMH